MILHTDRLNLYALTIDQLYMLLNGRNSLAHTMGWSMNHLILSNPDFSTELDKALEDVVIPGVEANPDKYLWYTHWIIHLQEENKDIGGIGLSGYPDSSGTVMTGYYIDQKYEGKGYATEALEAMLDWLEQHPEVKRMIADTPAGHLASQKVLANNGFNRIGPVEEGVRWEYLF